MEEFDPETFRLRRRGHSYDDFAVGQVFHHHWGRTLTESDAIQFNAATCNFLPMYMNREFAMAHGHRDIVVSPMLVLATVVGLSVEDLSELGGPFLGIEDCQFHSTVYPGDTIRARSTVQAMRESQSRPEFGTVTWRTEGIDQSDALVISLVRSNLVRIRRKSKPAEKRLAADGQQ